MKTMNLSVAIGIIVTCSCLIGGCAAPPTCTDRACATAQVAMEDTCVLIACGYYDPAPLERPGAPHVECMRWWHGRWEFGCLDEGRFKSKGTAIYGFQVERYYMYHDFVGRKAKWGIDGQSAGMVPDVDDALGIDPVGVFVTSSLNAGSEPGCNVMVSQP